jgi:thioredoxin-dependent peroxiredoxin
MSCPPRASSPTSADALDAALSERDQSDISLIPIGAPAPPFSLRDSRGRSHSLVSLRGSTVVLYFYPKDSSAACTEQACAFEARRPSLRRKGVVLLGVSPDPAPSHARFAETNGLHFPLLVDERDVEGTPLTCERYGVWQRKTMYGKAYMGVVRTTYIIDPRGCVTHRFDAVKVKGHVDAVLAALGFETPSVTRPVPVRRPGRTQQKATR